MTSGFQVSGSAPEQYERFNPPIMAPFIEALLEAAAVAPGASILDVACGTGLASRAAATLAGPRGQVHGLDLNEAMLGQARSIGTPPGLAAIEWHVGSALDLPFADATFDAVICQQGLQFFPDLELAVREMRRVATPGARVAATFWAALDEQSYMRVQVEAARAAVGDAARAIEAGFALDGARAADAFTAAGLRDVLARRVTATVALPDLEAFALGQLGSTPTGAALYALAPEARAAYARRFTEELAAYRGADGVFRCPFVSWLVSGVR